MSEVSDRFRPPYWRMIEPYWDKISIYDGGLRFLADSAAAPEAVRHLFAAHWLQSEVRNGGFTQFLFNHTGVLAPEASQAFAVIGMPHAAEFVDAVIANFGPDYPREQDEREERIGPWVEQVDDEAFFGLLQHENGGFLTRADAYAKRHGAD